MHFIVWPARRSGWLDILIPCYTDDNGYSNQLCGGGSKTVQWTVLGQQLETLRMIDFCLTLKIEHG